MHLLIFYDCFCFHSIILPLKSSSSNTFSLIVFLDQSKRCYIHQQLSFRASDQGPDALKEMLIRTL
ncbi:hypothetical protein C5167_042704 [Papaver somniferum]|uniref:Uncharacterized protein n=1 Tax=Papaver somniferum TaxID=3469 RepID=A0A4Y7L777_PAPSO|nr:hypothetical protein C5167_042704 [Papaver somniferum]